MIAAAIGALALGLSLGFLGSGGSILAVPILVYLLGQEAKVAITGSLAVVGAVAFAGGLDASLRRSVAWRTVGVFGVAGMGGSALGAVLGSRSPASMQLALFGGVLLVAASAMAFQRQPCVPPVVRTRSVAAMAFDGFLVGMLTGYVGVGGGFLIVPALALLGGLPMALATGTSLVLIGMNAATALVTNLVAQPALVGSLDWPVLALIAAVGAAGSVAGRRLAGRFADRTLRRVFATALVLLALVVLRDAASRLLA